MTLKAKSEQKIDNYFEKLHSIEENIAKNKANPYISEKMKELEER